MHSVSHTNKFINKGHFPGFPGGPSRISKESLRRLWDTNNYFLKTLCHINSIKRLKSLLIPGLLRAPLG